MKKLTAITSKDVKVQQMLRTVPRMGTGGGYDQSCIRLRKKEKKKERERERGNIHLTGVG
jgi:hypothetical protein